MSESDVTAERRLLAGRWEGRWLRAGRYSVAESELITEIGSVAESGPMRKSAPSRWLKAGRRRTPGSSVTETDAVAERRLLAGQWKADG